MVLCVLEETGWERLPTGAGHLVPSVRPATAAPAGETSARQKTEARRPTGYGHDASEQERTSQT